MYIDVGLKIPDCGEGVVLRIKKPQSDHFDVYVLTVENAKELARGLQLMADLHEKLRKEEP